MKKTRLLLPFFVFGFLFTSCSKDDDITEEPIVEIEEPVEEAEEEADTRNLEVEEFIYAGMNEIYLYKADVPTLADGYFSTELEWRNFLDGFDSPLDLYEGLQTSMDGFSFMTENYVALENNFAGKATTNGMQLGLFLFGNNEILAIVNYVLPNTPAEEKGIKRGVAFTEVNGKRMTLSNYQGLLAAQNYTITIAEIKGSSIYATEETVTLNKVEYNTNPVYITKTMDVDGRKVGYLMYNSFTANYDEQLNNAFAELQTAGITDLVLDLRYNGGGSVASAVGLAGMITGQYKDQVFLKQQWNEKYQNAWPAESYINRFKDNITLDRQLESERDVLLNSLGLNKVYVLTTDRTASASELIINGLDPYIDVVQIGTTTTGKFQASVTLYDSPNFGREGANENHTYAIQPLVYKSTNKDGVSDYVEGIDPDIEVEEDPGNMGVLGDKNEPLLKAALNQIAGIAQDQDEIAMAKRASFNFKLVGESGMNEPGYQRMYIEELPDALKQHLKEKRTKKD